MKIWFSNAIPYGWLLCNGQSCASYLNLATFLGKDTVPDLRGEFLRGAGANGHSGQGNGGTVGQHQDATSHLHTRWGASRPYIGTPDSSGPFMSVINTDTNSEPYHWIQQVQAQYCATSEDPAATYNSRYTSRPTNTSVNYIIKW